MLVLVGITGLIMPIMPGWIFLIPGLVILADYFPPVRRLVDWARAKATGATRGRPSSPGQGPVNDTPGNG